MSSSTVNHCRSCFRLNARNAQTRVYNAYMNCTNKKIFSGSSYIERRADLWAIWTANYHRSYRQ